jgi:hypothetical protein
MKFTDHQMAQFVAAARIILKRHSKPFLDINKMVTDAEIVEGATEALAAVTDDQKPVKP